ncbi:hypothetical protein ASC87_13210 [Rhizobacter sp. Root1221]|nr:hypothetical protein ASC87_13210 [Rhizobacter sp. Root1221]
MRQPVGWSWRPREDGAVPQAAVAWGPAAAWLRARVDRVTAPVRQRLHVTSSRDVLVLFGAADDLPWVSGVAYAAPSADAPSLWLPTLWSPDVPADLLARALAARHGRTPLLLWPDPAAIVPLDRQGPLAAPPAGN